MPPTSRSRFRLCSGVVDFDGDLILTDPEPYTAANADDESVVMTDGDSLQRIAYRRYGFAELWWVVADRAGIYDPTISIAAGTVLTIPSSRTVNELILNESRRREFQA